MSVCAFCLQYGLIETAYYNWGRELRARDAGAVTSPAIAAMKSPSWNRPSSKPLPPAFVPLTLLHGSTLSAYGVASPASHWAALDARTEETMAIMILHGNYLSNS